MNNLSNIPNNSVDSDWKYNFGEGFSRVHVEFQKDGCHIQLLKQSFWESVANVFLKLFNQEPIQPHIEDRVINYPAEIQKIDQKIETIRDKIFQLQNKGVSPSAIRRELIVQEETERNKALQALILNQKFPATEEPKQPIHHNTHQEKDTSSDHSTEQQDHETSPEQQQPGTKHEGQAPHEVPLPIDSDNFDNEEIEPDILGKLRNLGDSLATDKDPILKKTEQPKPQPHEIPLPTDSDNFDSDVEVIIEKPTQKNAEQPQPQQKTETPTQTENTTEVIKSEAIKKIPLATDLTHEEKPNETVSHTKNYMKYAGLGVLAIGGIGLGIAASMFADKGSGSTFDPSQLQLQNYDNKLLTGNDLAGLNLDLIQACQSLAATNQSLASSNRCLELHVDLDFMEKSLAADSSGSNMDLLARRIELTRNNIQTLTQTILEDQPANPCLVTPLTELCETNPSIHLSQEQFVKFISQSFSGRTPPKPMDERQEPHLTAPTDYLRDRLKLLGTNPEQKQIAISLEKSLASIAPLEKQLNDFSIAFREDLIRYTAEIDQVKHKKLELEQENAYLEAANRYAKDEQIADNIAKLDKKAEQLNSQLKNSWDTGISKIKTHLSDLFMHSTENGFFLPVTHTEEFLQFIPEKSIDPFTSAKTWTVRRYTSTPSQEDATHQPFEEIKGITESAILLKDDLLAELVLPQARHGMNPALLNTLFPGKQTNALDKLFEKKILNVFTNVHDFPFSSQSALNNLLFVELGPEAYLDFQISTAKHYIDRHADELIADPHLNALVRNTVSSLAYAAERAGAQKWIDYPALQEKSRILHEIGNTLRNIDIKIKKQHIAKAPVADESFGKREIAKGEIPAGGTHPLQKTLDTTKIASEVYVKPITFPKTSVPLPVAGNLLNSHEIDSLVKGFDTDPKASLDELRAWSAKVLPDPASLNTLNPQETESMLASLASLAKKMETANIDTEEASLALIETVAIADHLLKSVEGIPEGTHLPVHQMISQLQNAGKIDSASFHPQLLNQAEEISKDPSKLIFNEVLLQRKDNNFYRKSYSKTFEYSWKNGVGSVPWDTIRLMTTKNKSDLPLQVRLAVPKWESLSNEQILDTFYDYQYTGTLKSIREIAEAQARFAAKTFTTGVEDFSKELAQHLPAQPQVVIDAINRWSKQTNPGAMDRSMLEMLTQDQRVKLIDSFGQIAQTFLTANFQTATMLPPPETMIRFIELLAMTDQVMAYSTDREMTRFQVPLEEFSTIIKGQGPFFRTFDPIIDTVDLQNIKDWQLERESFLINEGNHLNNPLFTDFSGFFKREWRHEWQFKRPNSLVLIDLLISDSELGHRLITFREEEEKLVEGLTKFEKMARNAFVNPDWVSPETGKSLPSWFYSLRDLTHFSIHTLRSGFINPGKNAKTASFHPHYSVKSEGRFKDFIINSLDGVTPEDLAHYPEITDGNMKGHLFSHLEMSVQNPGINQDIRDIQLRSYLKENLYINKHEYYAGVMHLPRDVYDLNIAMTKDTNSNSGLYSSDDYRKKWSLRGVGPLQISQTISTYLEHPEWLTRIDEQIEFLSLLFDPGLLWQHLQEGGGVGPRSEADLSKFLHTQYQIHDKNPELQAFFAEVGLRLNQYSAAARKSSPDVYKDIPVPKELQALANLPKKMTDRKGLPTEEKSIYGALYAISFIDKPTLEAKEMIEFMRGLFSYRSDAPLKMVNIKHIDRQIDGLLTRIQPELMEALYPNGQLDQNILTQMLIGTVDTSKIVLKPSATHPLIFSDAEHTLEINLQEGTIIQKGREGIPMPAEARFSMNFKSIHGSKNYRAKAIDRFTFQFVDDQGHTNIIQKDAKTNDWNLYRQFEDSKLPFQSVTASWMKSAPWLKSKTMLSEYTHWHRQGVNGGWTGESISPEVRLLDKNGKLAFTVELTGNEGHEIKRIVKADSTDGELILADIDQRSYSWARQFEDPGFIHAWMSPETGKGQHIEFLRAGNEGLAFSWKNNQWQLDSTPQYHVAKRQINPLFTHQGNFLLLETDRGEQRLLIPKQAPEKTGYHEVNIPFDRQTKQPTIQHILSLDKNPKTGKFESQDRETNLYLAMLQLGHRNYSEAHQLLTDLARNEKGRFSDSEMEILDWMIGSDALPLDETPQSIAIRTFAAQIKSRNMEKNPVEGQQIYQVPGELSKAYLRHIQGLSGMRMSPLEEANLLFKGLHAGKLPVVETIAELQISDPENARKAIDTVIVQRRSSKKPLDLSDLTKPATPLSIPLNAPRPDVVTPQQFDELVRIEKSVNFQEIPEEAAAIFDYGSDWFKNLSGPTQEFFKNVESGVRQFQKLRDSDSYHLLDKDKFNTLLSTLKTDQHELSMEMVRLRFKIMGLANPQPSDEQAAHLLKLQEESGVAKTVSFETLINAFIKNDLRSYQSLNSNMNREQAAELDLALQTFIDIVPEWEYRQRLNSAMEAVVEAKENPELEQAALKNFVKAKNSTRQFSHDTARLMKVMEYQTGFYYHKGQIDSLGAFGFPGLETSLEPESGVSGVHRITVGAGKTSRLLPSLLELYAEEGKLALAVMPEAQLTSAGREFTHIMQEVYNKPTFELEFTLKDASAENLEAILHKLKTSITQGTPVMTSGKSLRVMRNLFVDNIVKLIKDIGNDGNDVKLKRKALALKQIVGIIQKTKPIIDEVHKEYDPRVETNNPIGEARVLNEEFGVLTLNLYEIISEDPDIKQAMHFNFMTEQPLEGAKPFSQERFQKDIAPLLADKFLQKLETANSDPELNTLMHFYKGLSVEQKTDIRNYVLKTSSSDVIKWVEGRTETIRDQLGLLRGELNVLLPLTLNRNFGERYGFSNANDIMAIPFASADNPNIGSQFSSPYERYNYLIQALVHEGARLPMFEKIVAELQRERLKELTAIFSEGKNIEIGERIETRADVEFANIFKTNEWNLDTPDVTEKLFHKIGKNPALFRQLVKIYALPLVKSYPKNLKATSQHLGNQFDDWEGMSGTPGNYPTYPGKYRAPKDEAVIGRMLTLMAEHTIGKTQTVKIRDPKQILVQACQHADAFMDAGGILAAENLEKIADAWGEKAGKATVRIDREEGIVIKQTAQDKATPLRSSTIPTKDRITLYGQSDIVGTDISHKPNAIGIVSISATTTLSTSEQAAGRMRGIETGQRIEFLVLEDDAVVMRENLALPPDHELTSQDVLRHLMMMESKKQMVDTEVALRQKLQAVLDNYVYNWLVDSDPEVVAKLKGVDNLLESLFYPPTAESPFEIFGREDVALGKKEAFEREIERLTGPNSSFVRMAAPVFGEQTTQIISNLRSEMQSTVADQLQYISETIVSRPDTDMEQEQELLQEQNVQIEQQQSQEVELQQEQIQQPPVSKQPQSRYPWRLTTKSIVSWGTYSNRFQSPTTPLRHAFDDFKMKIELGGITNSLKYEINTKKRKDLLERKQFLEEKIKIVNTELESEDLFGEEIALSNNFNSGDYHFSPQKPVQNILIAKNSQTGDYRLLILEPAEALYFKQVNAVRENINIPGLFVKPAHKGLIFSYTDQAFKDIFAIIKNENADFDPHANVKKTTSEDDFGWTPKSNVQAKTSTPSESAEIWVGDVTARKIFGNDATFNLEDPKLFRLWLQIQVFAGNLNFSSDREKALVKDWLDKWSKAKADEYTNLKPKGPFLDGRIFNLMVNPQEQREGSKQPAFWLDKAEKMIKKMIAAHEDVVAGFHKTDFGKILADLKQEV